MARPKLYIQKDIDDLKKLLEEDKITIEDYAVDISGLQKELDDFNKELKLLRETKIDYVPSTQTEKGLTAQVFHESAKPRIKTLASKYFIEKYEPTMTPEEEAKLQESSTKRAEKIYGQFIKGQLVGSKEFDDMFTKGATVSNIVDPVRGLIYDEEKKAVRKATPLELVKETFLLQPIYTPEQKKRIGRVGRELSHIEGHTKDFGEIEARESILEELPDDIKEQYKKEGLQAFRKKEQTLAKEFAKDPQYKVEKEAAVIPESGLDYSFRQLNRGSAFVAPIIDLIQKGVSIAPISTREGAGYKKSKMEGFWGQVLTNQLENQGVINQFQAQLLPPENDYDGVAKDLLTQGTGLSMLVGVMAELGPGITVTGSGNQMRVLAKEIAKRASTGRSPSAQSLLRLATPLDAMSYSAKKKELAEALGSVATNKTVKQLEKEIAEKGGSINQNTMSEASSKIISDTFAGQEAIIEMVSKAENLKKKEIKLTDSVLESPFIKNFFGKKTQIPLDEASNRIKAFRKDITKAKDGKMPISLQGINRYYSVADAVKKIIKGKKLPKLTDSDAISRAVNYALMKSAKIVPPKAGTKGAQELYDKIIYYRALQKISRLDPEEIIDYGRKLLEYDETGNIKKVINDKVIYDAIDDAVSAVAKDEFVKNNPQDLILVGKTGVVVTPESVKRLKNNKKAYKEYEEARRSYLGFTAKEDKILGSMAVIKPESVKNILAFQRATGFDLPAEIVSKLKSNAPLNPREFNQLQNIIGAELAVKHLDGFRLKAGGLQQEASMIKDLGIEDFIPIGQTYSSSFKVSVKEIARTIQTMRNKNAALHYLFAPFELFSKTFVNVPATFLRAQAALTKAKNAASAILEYRIKRNNDSGTLGELVDFYIKEDAKLDFGSDLKELYRSVLAGKKKPPSEPYQTQQTKIATEYYTEQRANLLDNYFSHQFPDLFDPARTLGTEAQNARVKTIIEDIQTNMPEYIAQFHQAKVWERIVKRYFGDDFILSKYQTDIIDIIRNDKNARFYIPGNIIPINPENIKIVVNELKSKYDSLKKMGVGDNYFKVLVSELVDIQTRISVNKELYSIVAEDPSAFLDFTRLSSEGIGLGMPEAIAKKIMQQVNDTKSAAVISRMDEGKAIATIEQQVNQILMDGLQVDIFRNGGRDLQVKFITEYIQYIASQKTLPTSIHGFLQYFVKKAKLNTNTIDKIQSITDRIRNRIDNEIFREHNPIFAKKQTPNEVYIEKVGDIKDSGFISEGIKTVDDQTWSIYRIVYPSNPEYNRLFTYKNGHFFNRQGVSVTPQYVGENGGFLKESTKTEKNGKHLDDFVRFVRRAGGEYDQRVEGSYKKYFGMDDYVIPEGWSKAEATTGKDTHEYAFLPDSLLDETAVARFEEDYLMNLLGSDDPAFQGLFSQVLTQMNDKLISVGISRDLAKNSLKEFSPKVEFIGKENIAVIYDGLMANDMEKLLEIFKNEKTLNSMLKNNYSTNSLMQKAWRFAVGTANFLKRWGITSMLTGVVDIATRFLGVNRFTAPIIMMTSIGQQMKVGTFLKSMTLAPTLGVLDILKSGLGKSNFTSNYLLVAPPDEVLIKAKMGGATRDWTAGQLREAINFEGIESSRADFDFYDTLWNKFLVELNRTKTGKKGRNKLDRFLLDRILPGRKNFGNALARSQDAEMRRLVFVEALESGKSVEVASELARRSMLDYNSLTELERDLLLKLYWFYSFNRVMGSEVINAFYRNATQGIDPSLRILKIQNAMSKEAAEDYGAYTSMQQGALYNLYVGAIDGTNAYVSGPENPMMQGFQFMMMAPLYIASALDSTTNPKTQEDEKSKWELLKSLGEKVALDGSPAKSLLFDFGRKRKVSFPPELIYQAEAQGFLDDLVDMYSLKKVRRTPGRSLAEGGFYYNFDDARPEGYYKYLLHRLIGMTALGQLSLVTDEYEYNTILGLGFGPASMQRAERDRIRAEMFAEGGLAPYYIKSLNKQGLDVGENTARLLYLLGLARPGKDKPSSKQIIYPLRQALKSFKDFDKSTE